MNDGYWAVIEIADDGFFDVYFPDLEGCVTFSNDLEEALDMAEDVLAGYLAVSEKKYIKKPSSYDIIYEKYGNKKYIYLRKIKINKPLIEEYKNKIL